MRAPLAFIVAVGLFSVSTVAWQARPAQPAQPAQTSVDDVLQAVRGDLIDNHADVLAKNMTLTSDQAAKFWPMYANYQKEQSAILDSQLKGIQDFIEKFDKLDDATAMKLIKSHFDRDAEMAKLREKWLGDFQKVLGTKLAVRAMQIDRRVSLIQQFQLTTKIPLAQ
jgi:Spy/CpxP family protein refolding chaperone